MSLSLTSELSAHIAVFQKMQAPEFLDSIALSGARIIEALDSGHTLYICGNGGSAADAQHIAAELTGRYLRDRRSLSAVALSTDTSALTAIGNDYGFEYIFSRQLEGLGRPGDILLVLSTSGNSPNIIEAVKVAREKGMATIGLLGRSGGQLASLVDLPIIVPSDETPRIQEGHIFIYHSLCAIVDEKQW